MIKSTLVKANYKTARNKRFHALKKEKQEFYTILFKQQNNMKQTWNTFNTYLGTIRAETCSSFKINKKSQMIPKLFRIISMVILHL